MKTLLIFALVLIGLAGCYPVTPEPADPLTQTVWCNAYMNYRFDADGSFTMSSAKSGQTWGGSWSYTQDRIDLEINLHYGSNRLIQIIRLRGIQCTQTGLTARWTDELAQVIPFECFPCTSR